MKPIFKRLCQAYADKNGLARERVPLSPVQYFIGLLSNKTDGHLKPIEESSFISSNDFLKFTVQSFHDECCEYLSKAGFPDVGYFLRLVDDGHMDMETLKRVFIDNYNNRIPEIEDLQDMLRYHENNLAQHPQNVGIQKNIKDCQEKIKQQEDFFVSDLGISIQCIF